MSAFDKHHDELEKHETMMGQSRGRLAVALDLLTDALAMVGQHGVYCQSARTPGRPTMDIALVLEQIGDAKELVQSVIETERWSMTRDGRPRRSASSAHYNLLERLEPVRSRRAVSRARHEAGTHGRHPAAARRFHRRTAPR